MVLVLALESFAVRRHLHRSMVLAVEGPQRKGCSFRGRHLHRSMVVAVEGPQRKGCSFHLSHHLRRRHLWAPLHVALEEGGVLRVKESSLALVM